MAQFPNLALKILDPGLLLTGGPVAGTSIAFRLPTPAPQAIWSTAKLGRYCLISSVVTAIFRALFIEKPNAARAELSRIRRGMFALCHKVHPWRVLLSGKPGAVQIIDLALEETQLSPRELAVRFTDTRGYFVSEASVYRLLKAHDLITSPAFVVIKAADEFRDKTTAPNQLWQTDFTYLKVIGWGWFYLSTILDDYSRYIIAWKLCTNMTADDVTATLKLALEASGCNRANVVHKPRLLSDNGSSYISGDLAEWLEDHGMDHVRGAPYHPQTQGKIERWHQTLKNRILLENYYLPGDLENQISAFVDHYNNRRYHESIGNVTPADAYFGRHTAIIEKRKRIKKLHRPMSLNLNAALA